mmetsp:Transcript_15694/g.45310  ORF Transcript_15694/g.45310 Transcript_15694/m.45310 type:complete len:121 (+) Transcript_15694:834-1196(+)
MPSTLPILGDAPIGEAKEPAMGEIARMTAPSGERMIGDVGIGEAVEATRGVVAPKIAPSVGEVLPGPALNQRLSLVVTGGDTDAATGSPEIGGTCRSHKFDLLTVNTGEERPEALLQTCG